MHLLRLEDCQSTATQETPDAVTTVMLLARSHTCGTSQLSDGVQERLAAPEHLAEPCTESFCTRKKRLSTGEPSSPLKSTADRAASTMRDTYPRSCSPWRQRAGAQSAHLNAIRKLLPRFDGVAS
ncbi:hypothetical protein NDU88_004154 [Pleurodeles waltl]|uniref:Uncharacterized protein n=1 Tax=Pleurodeles waltl TaxID=8319 RepID=A0AAV7RHW8_PLEWA|nr:hypothetical protein NDU88_004154 [Pleurodeles waltl]